MILDGRAATASLLRKHVTHDGSSLSSNQVTLDCTMDPKRAEIAGLIEEATNVAAISIDGLAEAAGISPHSIWAWIAGRRSPRDDSVLKLADELETRSAKLADLDRRLRKAAEK